MRAIHLRTEYLKNPLGIDIAHPYLMWQCDGGVKQTAYRIVASRCGKTVWDSGKVSSGSMRAEYPKRLTSRERIEWRVILWDEVDSEGELSEAAYFEMTLLEPADFYAKWITGNYRVNRNRRYPVDCFCKTFTMSDVAHARLYITACGLYEARVNGIRVGNFVLAPGHTDYTKRVQLQTYDVTQLLIQGDNIMTVQLADGWYRGSCGAWGRRNQYGRETKLYAQLEITDSGGSVHTVVTDDGWGWSDDGEIRFADNKDGEIIDARMKPTYSGRAKATSHNVTPRASNNVPITDHEAFKPTVIKTPLGKAVLDFGQNIAGYVSFSLTAKDGQTLKLRFGELLDKGGEFTQKNIQLSSKKLTTPLQQVVYTCREGLNEYKTTFAVFGFRYVLIETDIPYKPEDFTAMAVYSDMDMTVAFDSSNELLNKFVNCTLWSAKNNHADVPTDCPTRERHGWTGDAQIFSNTAAYMFQYAPFARKYIGDMTDGQHRNGNFRQISPKGGIDFYMNVMDGSSGWSDAGVLIPYRIWKRYGERRILEENYSSMKKYALYKIKTMGKWYPTAAPTGVGLKFSRYISNYGQSYGEWAEPADVKAFAVSDFISPHAEETTAYIVYMLERMAEIAETLGKSGDCDLYRKYSERARVGYRKLVGTKKYSLDTDRQAKLVRPLYFGLLDDAQTEYAKNRLLKALDNYGWRLGTGFLATPFILDVLADINTEYAYHLLENEEMPGWLFMPKNGATTIWESWEGTEAQNGTASLDHYSKGAVCEWIFSRMCGINVSGENSFKFSPIPGGSFTHAACRYDSIYGTVSCGWKRESGKTIYEITVPPNTEAEIILPGEVHLVTSGTYSYICT